MKYLILLISLFTGLSLSAQTEGCNGATLPLTASAGFASYAWDDPASSTTASINVTTAGSYTVTVTDGNGCTATDTHVVTYCPALTSTNTTVDNTTCMTPYNGSATATASGGCSGGYTYLWNTTPAQTTATATGLQGGTYEVVITTVSSSGCVCEITETIVVTDTVTPPVVTITGACN